MKRSLKIGLTTSAILSCLVVGGVVFYLGNMTSRACSKESIAYASLDKHPFFSATYKQARTRFVTEIETQGGKVENVKHPLPGPDGSSIHLDHAFFGPKDASNILVISSGTHGLEGFAGSGLQLNILNSGILAKLPKDTGLMFIHAVNPYGMAHLRRVNEDNVDLNRNFRDHSLPPPENIPYQQLADSIAPKSINFWSEVSSWANLLWYRATEGGKAARKAMSSGQYSHPKGLFYGGLNNVWSNTVVREVLTDQISDAKNVIIIDVHTGLGEYGTAEVILNSPQNSPEVINAENIWGTDSVRTTVTGTSVSVHLSATMKLAFQKLLPEMNMTAVSLEYGTLSGINVVKALRAENWLHHHGGDKETRREAIKNCALSAFYPDDEAWREAVLLRGNQIVTQALASFSK